ncbi:M20 family metallo-hydrolase [Herbaspirillum sp. YR522]|uniref:M20 family metallo-hydrolase n=1 Tax=Herbaspirillum sp. YR522 TaxID=1144342 RepID=UPI00026FC476|nr:M20 family metallo-hydrolase [Herbaspirillum sp. YR522]EJN08704.1 amidase, hydantoinase/carbamoylase family [Herbaspirillum sp. YR522]
MSAVSAQVSEARLWQRHEQLATIGATATGGVNRQALSAQDFVASRQLIQWGQAIGMHASRDAAGNVFLTLPGSDPAAPAVLSGSHLDSQPTGGKYDGVYGVLAALEACEAIHAAGIKPRRNIEVVAWMNEEGSRFAPGMMGSAVFAGARRLADIEPVQDSGGTSVKHALADAAVALDDIVLRPIGGQLAAYVEAHIEQGPVLERDNTTIGVVTGIQGKRTFQVTVQGEAAHAGTSTRAERRDALLAAIDMVQALTRRIHDAEDIVKFTVGRFTVTPNAPSVVPSSVTFSIDLRHPVSAVLRELGDAIAPICQQYAGVCEVTVKELSTAMSLEFPEAMRERIRAAARKLGVSHQDILSAAGHDARYLHEVCPSAMIFIACHLGITHNEAEAITPADAAAGARVLTEVLLELANDR